MAQLGRYEILQQLARGSVADVLLARATGQAGFARHVVIKRIRPEVALDARFVTAFLSEARIGAALNHQNIVQVFDVDREGGNVYFAMEYVHGEDARKLLLKTREQNVQLPIDHVCAIGAAAAAGLHHAHELHGPDRLPLGLVHRDVSPSNILIGYDGSVKLVDFGLAKAALRSAKTRTGSLSGKAPYMSPELCTGTPIDRRSDVFALGIVLFELATSRRLFKGDNDFLTMAAIVEGEIHPPSTFRPDLPPRLDAIIMRALARAPVDRFQTANDLRAELESFAIESELRISAKPLADYMAKIFGPRVEPWHTQSAPVALDSNVDFDDAQGLVRPPRATTALSAGLAADAVSPLAIARNLAKDLPDPGVEADDEPTRAVVGDLVDPDDERAADSDATAIDDTRGSVAFGQTVLDRGSTPRATSRHDEETVLEDGSAARQPVAASPPPSAITPAGGVPPPPAVARTMSPRGAVAQPAPATSRTSSRDHVGNGGAPAANRASAPALGTPGSGMPSPSPTGSGARAAPSPNSSAGLSAQAAGTPAPSTARPPLPAPRPLTPSNRAVTPTVRDDGPTTKNPAVDDGDSTATLPGDSITSVPGETTVTSLGDSLTPVPGGDSITPIPGGDSITTKQRASSPVATTHEEQTAVLHGKRSQHADDAADEATTVSPPLFPHGEPVMITVPQAHAPSVYVAETNEPPFVRLRRQLGAALERAGRALRAWFEHMRVLPNFRYYAIGAAVVSVLLIGLLARACSSDTAPRTPPASGAR